MGERIKKFFMEHKTAVIAVLCVALIAGAVWLLHTNHSAGNNVDSTVQSIKDDNKRTGELVKSAADQVDEARGNISGAVERADRVEELTRESQSTVIDCEQLVNQCQDLNREAESIFTAIDRSNQKGTGNKEEGTVAE